MYDKERVQKAEKAFVIYFVGALVPIIIASLIYLIPKYKYIEARKNMEKYSVSPIAPMEAGDALVGPVTYTADATDQVKWTYFDFSKGSVVVVNDEKKDQWDVKMQRIRLIFNTHGPKDDVPYGIITLGPGELEDYSQIDVKPASPDSSGYLQEIEKWYEYTWIPTYLYPKDLVYGIHTVDGKYVKFKLLSYYCEAKEMGCLTYRYVYQGNGSRKF